MSNYFTMDDNTALLYYQMPKVLIHADKYKKMNDSAKVLYVIALDLVKLSMKNNWVDDKGRVYIKLSVNTIKALLSCSNDKAMNIKKELDKYDLLEEERPGQGKANRFYLKKLEFSPADVYEIDKVIEEMFEEENQNSENQNTEQNSENQNSENQNSRIPKSRKPEFQKSEPINNDFKDIDFKDFEEEENINMWTVKFMFDDLGYDKKRVNAIEKLMLENGVRTFSPSEMRTQHNSMVTKAKFEPIYSWHKYFVNGILEKRVGVGYVMEG